MKRQKLVYILKVAAMLICAFYLFTCYGKKQSPLLGLAALLLAFSNLFSLYINTVLWRIVTLLHLRMFHTFVIFNIVSDVFCAIAFLLLALIYFDKINVKTKIHFKKGLPIITFVATFPPSVAVHFIRNQDVQFFEYFPPMFGLLYTIPFILLAFYNPLTKQFLK